MAGYILKKTAVCLATLFCVLVFIFVSARLTGNPFEVMYPEGLEPGQLEQYNAKYGLDQSYGKQFLMYLENALRGDFGDSLVERRPVTQIFFQRAGETLKLGVWAFLISVTLGMQFRDLSWRWSSFWYSATGCGFCQARADRRLFIT